MQSIKDAAAEFLADKRIAVTGVSRTPQTHGSNNVYRRLRERGYQVFAVNPNTAKVGGDRSYPDLASIRLHHAVHHAHRRRSARISCTC
jgi:predicted CoA-binding protein